MEVQVKTYTLSYDGSEGPGGYLQKGISLNRSWTSNPEILLGGGITSRTIKLFLKNSPEITKWGKVLDAFPLQLGSGQWVLAKDNLQRDTILLHISTRNICADIRDRAGSWDYNYNSFRIRSDIVKVYATGPRDYFKRPQDDLSNIGWRDALVVLTVGDEITYQAQGTSKKLVVKYESVEKGLVIV